MIKGKALHHLTAALAIAALAGCGGGGGTSVTPDPDPTDPPGPGPGPTVYEQLETRYGALATTWPGTADTPTVAIPTSGAASYEGVASFSTAPGPGADTIYSDVGISANFGSGTVSGQFSGFQGSSGAIAGSLAISGGTITDNEVGGTASGNLTRGGTTAPVNLTIVGGGFQGPDAGAIVGETEGAAFPGSSTLYYGTFIAGRPAP